MDAQQFLAAFGAVANAPGGVARLRQMIYQLAVTGALTGRGEVAQGATALLTEITNHRARLIRQGEFKRLPKLESEPIEPPADIELPATWCWSRLLDLGEISPRNEAADSEPAAFLPMSGISERHKRQVDASTRPWGEIKKGYTHFANGDVVLAKITPCFENGKAAVIDQLPGKTGIGAGTTELHVFRPIHAGLLAGYVYLFLRSPLFTAEGERNMTGTAGQKRLPTEYFALRAFPLPPTDEQTRIVAKVDELMALCDRLEQQQQIRRTLQNALRQATLAALANAQGPHALHEAWSRLEARFGQLFSAPDDVDSLRQLVLELAVRGHLSAPTDDDEAASAQLARIRKLPGLSGTTGRHRKSVTYRPVDADEIDYAAPNGWASARLGELVRVLNGRAYAKSELLHKGTPVLRVGNLFTSKDWYYSDLELDADKYCDKGDLLYAWSASFGPFIWDGGKVIFHYHIWKLDLISEVELSKQYLHLLLQERTEAIKASGHGLAMSHMTKEKMEQLPLYLPPIAEQQRIVQRAEALMRFCDELEARLSKSNELAEHYATAAIAALTGTRPSSAEAPMKAPQTTLIAPVRLGKAPRKQDNAPLATLLARHHGELDARELWQRFGGEVDAFYAQLKTEVLAGWIAEPAVAEMRETHAEAAEA